MIVVGGVFAIFLIRIIGSLESIQYDLRYLANKEKKLAELESEKHLKEINDRDKARSLRDIADRDKDRELSK